MLATTSTAQRYEPNRRRAVLATKFQANGGGAKACTVELAKSQNGRANKTTVQKTPEISFGLHYQENLSENPWCAVIGIEVAALPPRKWIFSQILLPVAPETDFQLLYIGPFTTKFPDSIPVLPILFSIAFFLSLRPYTVARRAVYPKGDFLYYNYTVCQKSKFTLSTKIYKG